MRVRRRRLLIVTASLVALVYWGRYVELVRYDSEAEELSLRTPSK